MLVGENSKARQKENIMKRYGFIFERIVTMDNLREAHMRAREDKHFYKEVKMVDANPDYYLKQIQEMLINKTYEVSKYEVSVINDKGKERELMKLPYFPDRIIQWAIMLQIEKIFMEVMCDHVCASIPGRGIKKAMRLTKKHVKDSAYCLKLDVRKFYPSINHRILKTLLRKKIKDLDVMELLDKIVDSYPGEKGVPIGSYLSQYLANYYLAYFDHWLKEEKHVTKVVRYMDDITIYSDDKDFLHRLNVEIKAYLQERLRLELKSNWQVFPVKVRGVDFVGYRFFPRYILLRKKTCKRMKKMFDHIKWKQDHRQMINYHEFCSANSYIGWLAWCDSFSLYEKYVTPVIHSLITYYYEVINPDVRKYYRKLIRKKGRCYA